MAMRTLTTIFLVLLTLGTSNSYIFNYHLIKDYLQWNNLKATLFVTCQRPHWTEINEISENIKNNDIWINHWDMSRERNLSDFDYKHFFVRSGYPFCVIVNWECSETQSLLKEISNRTLFHYERNWLMFGRNVTEMFHVLSEENINVDAEIGIVVPIGENDYQINDVYNPSRKRHGRFRMGKIGTWTNRTGLKMIETQSQFQRRRNLDGLTLLAAITIPKLPKNKTFIEHIDSDEFPFLDSMSKSNYRVFQTLMEMFNFKLAMRRAMIWGALEKDGTWLGAVGLINRSEIDVAISGLRWEGDRYGVFDQTTNSFYVQILFIFRHPKTVDAFNVFLSPFVMVVWILIAMIGIIVSICLKNFFVVEKRLTVIQRNNSESTENESSYSHSILMVFGILFQQGFTENPSLFSSRVLTITILMFSLIIYQFYGSFIVGSLLTEAPKTIKTMKQLFHSKLDFAMDEVPYIQDTFQHIREETAVAMYNKIMSQPHPFLPLYKGLNLVKQGSLAYNTDGSYAYAILRSVLTDKELCELQEVKYAQRIITGPGLPKKSPLRELIKIGIRKIFETGVLAHIWKTWIAHMPKCAHSDVDVVPVDMVHFSSALYALGFGIQISIGILIAELTVVYFSKCRAIIANKLHRLSTKN